MGVVFRIRFGNHDRFEKGAVAFCPFEEVGKAFHGRLCVFRIYIPPFTIHLLPNIRRLLDLPLSLSAEEKAPLLTFNISDNTPNYDTPCISSPPFKPPEMKRHERRRM